MAFLPTQMEYMYSTYHMDGIVGESFFQSQL